MNRMSHAFRPINHPRSTECRLQSEGDFRFQPRQPPSHGFGIVVFEPCPFHGRDLAVGGYFH